MRIGSIQTQLQRAPLLAVLAAALLAPPVLAQKVAFKAILNGANEVPPTPSLGTGTASVVVDMSANTLTFDLTYQGLTSPENAAHIHGFAPPGMNAPIVFALGLGFKKTGVWNYPQASEANIMANLAYFNVHTNMFPGGEIRGQLVRVPSPVAMSATIDGAQEVPANASAGKGTGFFDIDPFLNTLTFDITFDQLGSAENAAHFHGPAPVGMNAGIKFVLPLGKRKSGVWNYAQADEADILNGLYYVNVHSNNLPGGEIRGQILALATNPTTYCTAKTTSLGCTPAISATGKPSASAGSGFVATSAPVPGVNIGIFFYGQNGPAAVPFQGAFLCAAPPVLRTPGNSAGGTAGVCNGSYMIDFNAYVASAVDPTLVAGSQVQLQSWFRDPPDPVSGTGLSNGLRFELLP